MEKTILRGGAGSGHFGHEGREGEKGGSKPGKGGGKKTTGTGFYETIGGKSPLSKATRAKIKRNVFNPSVTFARDEDVQNTVNELSKFTLKELRGMQDEASKRMGENPAHFQMLERILAAAVDKREFPEEYKSYLPKKGDALPDGTFPIASCADISRAVSSLGRTEYPRAEVVRHLRERSLSLGCRMSHPIADKLDAVEKYVERREQREHANAADFQHVATIGEMPIERPSHIPSEVWRTLPRDHRTVRGEAIRRIIERNYAQAVEDAEMTGWKPSKSHYDPEEYFFSKRWPTGDERAPEVMVRSILIREADSLEWQLRPISSFASGSLAEKMPAGIVRHVRKDRMLTPFKYRGGPGSGHFGHAGRQGEVGGSAPGKGGGSKSGKGGGGKKVKQSLGPNGMTLDEEAALYEEAGMMEDAPDVVQTHARKKKEREAKGQSAGQALSESLPGMSLSEIASEIRKDWGSKVNFAAKPYLEALGALDDISQNYYADTGYSVVAYFLSNAGTWRGETARAVKKELKKRLKKS